MSKNESKKQKSGKKGKSRLVQITASLSAAVISICLLAVPSLAYQSGANQPVDEYSSMLTLDKVYYNYLDLNAPYESWADSVYTYQGDIPTDAILPYESEQDVAYRARYQLSRYPDGYLTARNFDMMFYSDGESTFDYFSCYYDIPTTNKYLGCFYSDTEVGGASYSHLPYVTYVFDDLPTSATIDAPFDNPLDSNMQITMDFFIADWDGTFASEIAFEYQVEYSYTSMTNGEVITAPPATIYLPYSVDPLDNDYLSVAVRPTSMFKNAITVNNHEHILTDGSVLTNLSIAFTNVVIIGGVTDIRYVDIGPSASHPLGYMRLCGEHFEGDFYRVDDIKEWFTYPSFKSVVYLDDDFNILDWAINAVESFLFMPLFVLPNGLTITLGSLLGVVVVCLFAMVVLKFFYGG